MNGAKALVLDDANIVATTLSFSGASLLGKIPEFDYVIIGTFEKEEKCCHNVNLYTDEAAQAVETSTLIPLQHKCTGLVLVGDPKQLPATIVSTTGTKKY